MDHGKYSLMTFTLDADIAMKKMTVHESLLLAKEQGIPHIDAMNTSGDRLPEYVDAIKETKLSVLCYIASVSFFSNDEQTIKSEILRNLQIASTLQAKLFMIVPLNVKKDRKICAKLGKNQVQQLLSKYFSLAVMLVRESGIKVCFETTPQDYTCLSGIEDCRWILQQVPQLGLVFDTANMLPCGDDPLEYYEALKNHIVHVHLKDVTLSRPTWKDRLFHAERSKDGKVMKCCVFGKGVIPLKEILRRMELDGYSGSYAIEYSHPDQYPADFQRNAQHLKEHTDFLD